MARGFGATLGAGTTDKITSALNTGSTLRSWFTWTNRNGDGGGSFGRVWQQGVTGTAVTFLDNDTPTVADTYRFSAGWSAGAGGWSFTRPSANVWHSIGVKYDWGSDLNNPTVYLNSTALTLGSGLTESFSPSGSAETGGGESLTIGNRNDDIRAWDGMLAEMAVWNVLLTDDEFLALADGYSPALIRPNALIEYIPMVRANTSYKIAAPTIVGTAVQPHPRVIMPSNPFRFRNVGGAAQTLFPSHFAKRSYVALVTQ